VPGIGLEYFFCNTNVKMTQPKLKTSLIELYRGDTNETTGDYLTFQSAPNEDLANIRALAIEGISFLHTIPNVKSGINNSLVATFDDGKNTPTIVPIELTQGWYDWDDITTALSTLISAASPDNSNILTFSLEPYTYHTIVSQSASATYGLTLSGYQCLDCIGFIDDIHLAIGNSSQTADHVPNLAGIKRFIVCSGQLTASTSILQPDENSNGYPVIASIPVTCGFGEKMSWEASDNEIFTWQQGSTGNNLQDLQFRVVDENGHSINKYLEHSMSILIKLYRNPRV
jgi:hypothetical protein